MKKLSIILILSMMCASLSFAQLNMKGLKNKAKSAVEDVKSTSNTSTTSDNPHIAPNESAKNEESVWEVKKVDMSALEEAPTGNFNPGGLFIGVGYPYMNNTQGIVMKSIDGKRWEPMFATKEVTCAGAAYGEGKLVVVGDQQILYTTDGNNWKKVTTTINHMFTGGFEDVAYGAGMFVAVGTQSMLVFSKDGENWVSYSGATVDPETVSGSTHLYGVKFANGKFYVTGNRNRVMVLVPDEKDGIYIEKNVNQGQIMSRTNDLAYGNGVYVAVGTKEDYISKDGQNWEETAPEWQNWGIAFGDNKFVKVCGFGRIFVSPNGSSNTWQEKMYAQRTMLWDVTYGKGMWVVSGKDGILYTSNDAEKWTSAAINPSNTLKKLIFID